MTDNYIPQPGDKISWRPIRPNSGIVKGEVDYVDLEKREAAVFIPPSRSQQGQKYNRRTRYTKAFDQLTLLDRPES